jgi:hypothetical protein
MNRVSLPNDNVGLGWLVVTSTVVVVAGEGKKKKVWGRVALRSGWVGCFDSQEPAFGYVQKDFS